MDPVKGFLQKHEHMNEKRGNAHAIKGIDIKSWSFETSFGNLSFFCSVSIKTKYDLPSQYSGLSYAKYQECCGGVLYLQSLKMSLATPVKHLGCYIISTREE